MVIFMLVGICTCLVTDRSLYEQTAFIQARVKVKRFLIILDNYKFFFPLEKQYFFLLVISNYNFFIIFLLLLLILVPYYYYYVPEYKQLLFVLPEYKQLLLILIIL